MLLYSPPSKYRKEVSKLDCKDLLGMGQQEREGGGGATPEYFWAPVKRHPPSRHHHGGSSLMWEDVTNGQPVKGSRFAEESQSGVFQN